VLDAGAGEEEEAKEKDGAEEEEAKEKEIGDGNRRGCGGM